MLALLLAGACQRPDGGYYMQSRWQAEQQKGRFEFDLPLDDSTAVYSTAIAARLHARMMPQRSLGLDITLTSPSGETSIEHVNMPLTEQQGVAISRSSGQLVDYEWPYRENIRIAGREAGRWHVTIEPSDKEVFESVYGIGLSYSMQWEKEN